MHHFAETWGLAAWSYNCASDRPEWGFLLGWGGKLTPYDPGSIRRFRHQLELRWIRLADCFDWWAEYLGVERGRLVINYRICGVRQCPIQIRLY